MDLPSVVHSTFVIERTYPAAPGRVFAAFAEPAQKRRWFAESDRHDVEVFEMDFRVGGAERTRYRLKKGNQFEGVSVASEGTFQDIETNRRVIHTSTMTFGDRVISISLVTVEFLPAGAGTNLVCTFQGAFLEGADGPQMREAGWRHLLEKLAHELGR
jgi:uncharacterized protein YndB with AHSA1/START domain